MSPAGQLTLRDVSQSYRERDGREVQALAGVDLAVEPGEFVALIGPSGCGKSTLLRIVAGLEQPEAGEVLLDGEIAPERLGRCAFMPQRDGLLPWRRAIDNVTVGLEIEGMGRARAREQALPLLERFGLGDFAQSWPWQLSGGMRHRAAFLRTAITGRPVMLLDEPFGALDGITRAGLQQWLLEVWRELGTTVLLVTHDVSEAVFLADRVVVMSPRPGRIVAQEEIPLARPRELRVEETPEFAAAEARLREALRLAVTGS
ncbi:MAG: ABC transporter ATP-binding protein [Solirubrobacterales bacterium]